MAGNKNNKRKSNSSSNSNKKPFLGNQNLSNSTPQTSSSNPENLAVSSFPATDYKFKVPNAYHPAYKTSKKPWKPLKTILTLEPNHPYELNIPTFASLDAPPSLLPRKKYCDISGLPGLYTDPKTKLRYFNSEYFKTIRALSEDIIEGYLFLRKDHVVLK
eukprot:Sdes_comp19192_c0_seq2m10035